MSNELTEAGHFDLSNLDSVLQRTGAIEPPRESINRIKVDGPNFIAEDDAWQTPVRGDAPALICRIVKPIEEYQAKWFTDSDADKADRPDMAGGKFCKSRFLVPGEAREYGTGGASCRSCPFNPFERGVPNKCAWKGDLNIQPFPPGDDPELTGEEPIYTLTLSTSAMFAWKGPSREGEKNFISELCRYAVINAQELYGITVTSEDTAELVSNRALGALAAGNVAAELRSIKRVDEARGREWYIPVFTPIHIDVTDEGDVENPENLKQLEGSGL